MLNKGAMKANYFHTRMQVACNQKEALIRSGGAWVPPNKGGYIVGDVCKTLHCDVAVIGGGVGGCAAAIAAARKGMRTILFEKGVTLGGLATNGYVPQVAGGIEGICLEFTERLDKIGQLRKIDPSKTTIAIPASSLSMERSSSKTCCLRPGRVSSTTRL